jgi:hypothetical protein
MPVHRCHWCGKFYSSEVPDSYGCPNHIVEHNAMLAANITKFNAKLKAETQMRTGAGEETK